MATNTIFIKRGDTSRVLQNALTYEDGTIIDLTNAEVSLIWNGTSKAATIVDEEGGVVRYSFSANDVATIGTVPLEWRIEFSDATFLTVPTTNKIVLRILEDLLNN